MPEISAPGVSECGYFSASLGEKMKRIHIVGSGPRTGTTLLAEVMATCFDIDHSFEHESSICTFEPRSGNCMLTKQPGEIGAIKWPLTLNPDLYVICIIRDPRDTVVSSHGKMPGRYWTGLRYWKLFVIKYEQLKKHPRFIMVRYEEFVDDPDAVQDVLERNIPFLERRFKFSEYHLHCQPSEKSLQAIRTLRPIESKGVGAWKKHLARVKQQIQIHGDISDELIHFGYESNKNWKSVLNDIPDVSYETVRPEYLGLKNNWLHFKNQFCESANIIARRMGLNPGAVFFPIRAMYWFARGAYRFAFRKSLRVFKGER